MQSGYYFKTKVIIPLFLLSAGLSVIYAQNEARLNKFNLDDKNYGSLIVADVGNIKITAQEFLTSYEFGPAFIKREKNSLRRYLDFMIYEKLLAFDGYSRGMDSAEDVSMMLSDIEGDLATEQLYRNDIWDKLSISEAEIAEGINKEQTMIQLKWIYKPSFEEIKGQYERLSNEVPFDTIFNEEIRSGINYEDRFLEETAFSLRKKNPQLSAIIDTLKAGSVTPPVKTPDGYYLFKLNNIWRSMITTETEMEKLKYDVRDALMKARADSVSDKYVQNLMLKERPVIIRETFNILKAHLGRKYLKPEKYNEWNLSKNVLPAYPGFDPEVISPYRKNILVEKKEGSITLEDFMKWFTTREPYINLNRSSHQNFFSSLQNVVWRMVRDRILTSLAFKEGLQKSDEVMLQKKWWRDKLVYSKMKLEIASSIKIDESKIKEFYNEHSHRYRDEKGNLKALEEVKNEVRNDLYSHEYVKKVVNRVLSLKERIPVNINENVLKNLPVKDEEDPKTIDVYSVKKGGTFMRQAFPVIDYEWQFWN